MNENNQTPILFLSEFKTYIDDLKIMDGLKAKDKEGASSLVQFTIRNMLTGFNGQQKVKHLEAKLSETAFLTVVTDEEGCSELSLNNEGQEIFSSRIPTLLLIQLANALSKFTTFGEDNVKDSYVTTTSSKCFATKSNPYKNQVSCSPAGIN